MSLKITGLYSSTYVASFWLFFKKYKHSHTNSHTPRLTNTHVTLNYMLVCKNMKRKLPLPNTAAWEIPVFHFTGRAGDAAGPDTHQTADEYGDGRKEGGLHRH